MIICNFFLKALRQGLPNCPKWKLFKSRSRWSLTFQPQVFPIKKTTLYEASDWSRLLTDSQERSQLSASRWCLWSFIMSCLIYAALSGLLNTSGRTEVMENRLNTLIDYLQNQHKLRWSQTFITPPTSTLRTPH